MKRLMVSFLAFITCIGLSAQQIDRSALEKKIKSKRTTNTIVGWSLLAGGTGLIIAGAVKDPGRKNLWAIMGNEYENSGEKTSMILGGILLAGGSLIFFEFANRNKDKLMELGLTAETISEFNNGAIVKTAMPALSLKLKL